MKRTTISLPEDLAAALGREARRRRVPVSQIAREAIEARLGGQEEGPREIPFAAIGASEGPGDVAENFDEYLKDVIDATYADAFDRDR